jgi:hypothetical protein
VETLATIGVLEQMGAVEIAQPVLVRREMRRHPVEDHTDAFAVQVIDEIHEVLRRAISRRGREIAGDLVAPRSVERVLHDGQDLDVREAERLDVRRQPRRQLAIAERAVVLLGHAHPRPEVDLVERQRRAQRVALFARPHPLLVAPLVVVEVPHLGAGLGRRLLHHRERIGLVDAIAVEARPDAIFVDFAVADIGNESLPDARLAMSLERGARVVPAVEIADHRHAVGVGRPYREIDAALAAILDHPRTELVVEPSVRALVEQVHVGLAQQRRRVPSQYQSAHACVTPGP